MTLHVQENSDREMRDNRISTCKREQIGSEESRQTRRKRQPAFLSKHLRAVTLLSLGGLSFWAEEEEGAALRCQELAWGPEEKCGIRCHFSFADKL